MAYNVRNTRKPTPGRIVTPTIDHSPPNGAIPAPAMVEMQNLTRRYGDTTALDRLNWSAAHGVNVIAGPNGAGKSTLLRILATLDLPDEGTLNILAQDPATAAGRTAIRRRLGYVPQDLAVTPTMRADRYLDHFARLKGIHDRASRAAAVERSLDAVGLLAVWNKRIFKLSGGMQRRLMFAQALLADNTALYVLDEPFVGLDPQIKSLVVQRIADLGREATVIVSTHQLDDIAQIATNVTVLGDGVVAFQGTTQELARVARDHVWTTPSGRDGAIATWRLPDGRHRQLLRTPPEPGAQRGTPTPEEGYLWLLRDESGTPQAL